MSIIVSTGSGVMDSTFGKSQEPIKMLLEKDMEAHENMAARPKLFKEIKSKNFAEKFTSLTALDDFTPVGEAGAYPTASIEEGYSRVIYPETWKNRFIVTKEMIEDKKNIDISSSAIGFTQAFGRTTEKFAASLFANGTNKTIKLGKKAYDIACADGKAMFAEDHPRKDGGTAQSNKFKDEFSLDVLSAMETAMQNFKDDKGNILNVAPDTIIIPNDYKLKKKVFEVIGADKDPATANNGFNYQFGRWNVIVWPYLTDIKGAAAGKTPFILGDSKFNKTHGGAVWIDRVPLSVHSYLDENNDNNVWNGRARFGAGFNNWRAFAIGGMSAGTQLVSAS